MQGQHITFTRRVQNVSSLYKQKKDVNTVTTLSTTSLQKRSILVFRGLGPVKKLPPFSPRNQTMKSLTATFSPPLSA